MKAFSLQVLVRWGLGGLFWRIITQGYYMVVLWVVLLPSKRTNAAASHCLCRVNSLQMGPQSFKIHLYLSVHVTCIKSWYSFKRECFFLAWVPFVCLYANPWLDSLVKEILGITWCALGDSKQIFHFGIALVLGWGCGFFSVCLGFCLFLKAKINLPRFLWKTVAMEDPYIRNLFQLLPNKDELRCTE